MDYFPRILLQRCGKRNCVIKEAVFTLTSLMMSLLFGLLQ